MSTFTEEREAIAALAETLRASGFAATADRSRLAIEHAGKLVTLFVIDVEALPSPETAACPTCAGRGWYRLASGQAQQCGCKLMGVRHG